MYLSAIKYNCNVLGPNSDIISYLALMKAKFGNISKLGPYCILESGI